ncbi:MAG: hypothetical protein BWK80_09675 [Desulfobacteraceae bacterium IS3]|nr:MAG: hypothetical protein BWK80_09675 [Desulfobacteraceae bacterium IS3]
MAKIVLLLLLSSHFQGNLSRLFQKPPLCALPTYGGSFRTVLKHSTDFAGRNHKKEIYLPYDSQIHQRRGIADN